MRFAGGVVIYPLSDTTKHMFHITRERCRGLFTPNFTTHSHTSPIPLSTLSSLYMSSTADEPTQLSAGEYPHPYGSAYLSPAPSSTLVNVANSTNRSRPSIKLKIPGASDILNSVVVDAAGQSLFSISSTSKRTTFVSNRGDVKVATIEWDRPSPLITLRQRKVKCKEWLPRAAPETEYIPIPVSAYYDSDPDCARSRVLTQGDTQFIWMGQSTSGYVRIRSRHENCHRG